jgi:hypothetical protein
MSVGLGIRRHTSETWLDAALRLARPYALEDEVREGYEAAIRSGASPAEAALHACYEWDVALLCIDGELAP